MIANRLLDGPAVKEVRCMVPKKESCVQIEGEDASHLCARAIGSRTFQGAPSLTILNK